VDALVPRVIFSARTREKGKFFVRPALSLELPGEKFISQSHAGKFSSSYPFDDTGSTRRA
jgi:hypothetical protein